MKKTTSFLLAVVALLFTVIFFFVFRSQLPFKENQKVPLSNGESDTDQAISWIEVDAPQTIRIGEKEKLGITLNLADNYFGSTFQNDLQDLFPEEEFYLNFETFLDLPGFSIEPTALMSANMFSGDTHRFLYRIVSETSGNYEGTIWIRVKAIPRKQAGMIFERPVLTRPIEIRVRPVWLFPARIARGLGFFGVMISSLVVWRKSRK